jgi:CheY-like chemotaxis protein
VVVAGDRRGFKAVARECLVHALSHRRARPVAILVATDAVSWGQYQVGVEVSFTGSWLARRAGEWWFAPPPFWRKLLGRLALFPENRLWVGRALAQKLGGSVSVSRKGRHATLRIEVPFGAAGIGPAAAPARVRRPGRRILLVEDEHYNRLVIGGLLKKLCCEVDWAADGADALALAGRHAYDAILIDWCLPDTDGGSLARRLTEAGRQPGTPMFGITGHVAPGRLDECRAAGMAAVVFKPVSEEKLFQVLSDWLILEKREPTRPTTTAELRRPHLARSYSA